MTNHSNNKITNWILGSLLGLLLLLPQNLSASQQKGKVITMTLPDTVLSQVVQSLLPLPIDTTTQSLQGSITINEVKDLRIVNGKLSCLLNVEGHDLQLLTEIGGHEIRLNVGSLMLQFRSLAKLSFDKKKQILFIKPTISDVRSTSRGGAGDLAAILIQFLNKREFPVTMQQLEPLMANANGKLIQINLKLHNIRLIKDVAELQFSPSVHLSRPAIKR